MNEKIKHLEAVFNIAEEKIESYDIDELNMAAYKLNS